MYLKIMFTKAVDEVANLVIERTPLFLDMESLGGKAMPYSTHLQKRERRYRKFLMSAEEERNFRKQGETSWGQRLPSRSKAEKRRGGGRARSSQASCERQ